jgi:hypothetical protein
MAGENVNIVCWGNQCAGKSNSGEGGEDPARWENLTDVDDAGKSPTFPHLTGLRAGDVASSRIKQARLSRLCVDSALCAACDVASSSIKQARPNGLCLDSALCAAARGYQDYPFDAACSCQGQQGVRQSSSMLHICSGRKY